MIAELSEKRDELSRVCADHKVSRLEVFGSAATQDAAETVGDLDFLVEFQSLGPGEYFDTYFGLLEALEGLFGKHVDLVVAKAISNPYFLESVNKSRTPLYAA